MRAVRQSGPLAECRPTKLPPSPQLLLLLRLSHHAPDGRRSPSPPLPSLPRARRVGRRPSGRRAAVLIRAALRGDRPDGQLLRRCSHIGPVMGGAAPKPGGRGAPPVADIGCRGSAGRPPVTAPAWTGTARHRTPVQNSGAGSPRHTWYFGHGTPPPPPGRGGLRHRARGAGRSRSAGSGTSSPPPGNELTPAPQTGTDGLAACRRSPRLGAGRAAAGGGAAVVVVVAMGHVAMTPRRTVPPHPALPPVLSPH